MKKLIFIAALATASMSAVGQSSDEEELKAAWKEFQKNTRGWKDSHKTLEEVETAWLWFKRTNEAEIAETDLPPAFGFERPCSSFNRGRELAEKDPPFTFIKQDDAAMVDGYMWAAKDYAGIPEELDTTPYHWMIVYCEAYPKKSILHALRVLVKELRLGVTT